MKIIGHVRSDFVTKFGIPRQAGIIESLKSTIVFEPEFRHPDAFRRLEEFSHIWVIWEFSEAKKANHSLTVRPPRLGGNTRVGVFASRSPFRPNSMGLSCVRLDMVEYTEDMGTVLHISGADMMDGTPVYDIKPYLPYTDSHPEATGGFTDRLSDGKLEVVFEGDFSSDIDADSRENLVQVLRHDPRPSYQDEPDRIYGMDFADYNIKFTVNENILTVIEISDIKSEHNCKRAKK
ncbi:MAG: tRNA (N6-threonylcarbamoyladenosine(37)-N6)-methyltransferase TrmO [Clostridia bacterium]|nr:tRNA (N6-threonylcarbamoyladenosine(37)-N6)-methyltransferase TrmO [Clostridia bacterium]